MKINKQHILGLIIGILTPFIFLPLVLFLLGLFNGTSMNTGWHLFTHNSHYTSKYLSLGCIPNLIWFYLFLNRENFSVARGIIFSTFLLVPFALYVNFIK